MSELLTHTQLRTHLENFKNLLTQFDYSALHNIRFLNSEALYAYMDTIPHNPFSMQYHSLQKELDYLQPYLPFVSPERACEFLNEMSQANNDEELKLIKSNFTQKLRQDFLDVTRHFTSDLEWESLFLNCEEIRLHKEEMCLALH